ncbi:MAG: hypothetical protein RLZZ519_2301 [Bacteroidota bacterium]|jgi:hypothetical protein
MDRHTLVINSLLERSWNGLHARLASGIPVIMKQPWELGNYGSQCMTNAWTGIVLGKGKQQVLDDLRNAAMLNDAHWTLAGNGQKTIDLVLSGHVYEIASADKKAFNSATDWQFAAYLALVLRDTKSQATILEAGNSFVANASATPSNPQQTELGILKAILTKDVESGLAQISKFQTSKSIGANESNILLGISRIKLWEAILHDNQAAADNELLICLATHCKVWGSKENSQDKNGWISLPLLAACAYAYDHGMDLNVESDYIPRWLVTGDFA